nr:hypothetical protein [Prevotella sp.]
MNKNIQAILNMLDSNTFQRGVLLDILESYGEDIALIPIKLFVHQKILRTRKNEDAVFGYIHELSYPPKEYARTDRASIEGKPMFYASIFTKEVEKSHAYPRIISALETIPLLRAKGTSGQNLITQSVWMIDEEVHVYSFPLSSQYKRACSEIYMLNSDWDKVLKNEYSEDSIEFFSFIGDLMAKPNESCLYEITATCIDFILEHYNFDGVLYPSVQAEGQGMNICIKPDVVDSKISFAGAATEVIVRNGDNSQIHILGNTHMITKDSFEWVLTNDGKMFLQQIGLLAPSFQNTPIVIRSESLM